MQTSEPPPNTVELLSVLLVDSKYMHVPMIKLLMRELKNGRFVKKTSWSAAGRLNRTTVLWMSRLQATVAVKLLVKIPVYSNFYSKIKQH
jgi:hypothetical protein